MNFTKTTEQDSNYNHLEKMSVSDLLININNEDKTVPLAIEIALPQIEALTLQIVQELQKVLGTPDVACVIDAKHLCVNSRGISDISSSTVTSEYGGVFQTEDKKREFLDYIKLDTDFNE